MDTSLVIACDTALPGAGEFSHSPGCRIGNAQACKNETR